MGRGRFISSTSRIGEWWSGLANGFSSSDKGSEGVSGVSDAEAEEQPSRARNRTRIEVKRVCHTPDSVIGELSFNGSFFCHTLEDKDRRLEDSPGHSMMSRKIPGQTAIPRGVYRLGITFSNRFQRDLPLLYDVPCFEGIRIHSGNDHTNTEGCILLGQKRSRDDFIYDSKKTMALFMDKIERAIENGHSIEVEIC